MYSLEGVHIENSEATADITWFSHANLSPRVGAENHVDHDSHNYPLLFLRIYKIQRVTFQLQSFLFLFLF